MNGSIGTVNRNVELFQPHAGHAAYLLAGVQRKGIRLKVDCDVTLMQLVEDSPAVGMTEGITAGEGHLRYSQRRRLVDDPLIVSELQHTFA